MQLNSTQLSPEGERELAAERRHLESREEAMRDTGREVGLSLDQGRSVLGRERDKLRDEADNLDRVRLGSRVRAGAGTVCLALSLSLSVSLGSVLV